MTDSVPSVSFATLSAVGVSSNCCSQTYCGSDRVSEPEAQAVAEFVGSRKDDILCFLTIHSYSQLLLIPYGNPNFVAPNHDELVFTSRDTKSSISHQPIHDKSVHSS